MIIFYFFCNVILGLFSEREENVKSDIFHAYVALLKQTRPTVVNMDPDSMEQEEGPLYLLQAQVIRNTLSKEVKFGYPTSYFICITMYACDRFLPL